MKLLMVSSFNSRTRADCVEGNQPLYSPSFREEVFPEIRIAHYRTRDEGCTVSITRSCAQPALHQKSVSTKQQPPSRCPPPSMLSKITGRRSAFLF